MRTNSRSLHRIASIAAVMVRRLLPALALLAGMAWAADSVQQQVRAVEAALARITQEQQSIYQQFQMAQELRRGDERQMQPLPLYGVPTSPNYEDIKRDEAARAQRVKDLQSEVDRLYARYRELEQQKKPLLEQLSALAQERGEAQPLPSSQELPNGSLRAPY
jgi:predicted  nucleic acid-binding Zn-ribbon protein